MTEIGIKIRYITVLTDVFLFISYFNVIKSLLM